MPGRNKGSTHPSRFQALADYLVTRTDGDAIIGHPLSVTARASGSMWTSATTAPGRCWRAVGWRARLDIEGQRVVFTRAVEGG